MKQDTIHFNSEVLISGVGGAIGAPIFALIASLIRDSPYFVSFFGMIGAVTGSSSIWLTLRVRNAKIRGEYYKGKLFKDIVYYTPAATILGLLVYQPTLFFLSSHLIQNNVRIFYAVIIGQVSGFLMFAILLNCYRLALEKITGKRL